MSETSTPATATGNPWSEAENRILTEAIAAERAAKNGGVNQRGLARALVAGDLGQTRSYSAIYIAIRRLVSTNLTKRWNSKVTSTPAVV